MLNGNAAYSSTKVFLQEFTANQTAFSQWEVVLEISKERHRLLDKPEEHCVLAKEGQLKLTKCLTEHIENYLECR